MLALIDVEAGKVKSFGLMQPWTLGSESNGTETIFKETRI
jgi:hypothetical protein